MIEDRVDWLVREVKDLLDVSTVGLYDFIWLLRPEQPEITLDEGRTIAELALRRLLSSRMGKLTLLTWPNHDSEGDVDPEALRLSDWDDPDEGQPYVALARN